MTKTGKTLLFRVRLRLWCCICILFLVSKLSDKSLQTHHHPSGIHPGQKRKQRYRWKKESKLPFSMEGLVPLADTRQGFFLVNKFTDKNLYLSSLPPIEALHAVWAKTKKTFWFFWVRSWFFGFYLDEKESLQGITVAVVRLAGCLHTSRITTDSVNTLTRVSFSARGFWGFCLNTNLTNLTNNNVAQKSRKSRKGRMTKTQKTPLFRVRLRLWCCSHRLLLVSKLTGKSLQPHHHPYRV